MAAAKISSHARFFTSYTATKSRQLLSANMKQAYSPRAVSKFKITSPPACTVMEGRSLPSWSPSLSVRNAVSVANDGEMDNASNEQFKICRKVRLRPRCQSYLRMNKDGSMEVAQEQGSEVDDLCFLLLTKGYPPQSPIPFQLQSVAYTDYLVTGHPLSSDINMVDGIPSDNASLSVWYKEPYDNTDNCRNTDYDQTSDSDPFRLYMKDPEDFDDTKLYFCVDTDNSTCRLVLKQILGECEGVFLMNDVYDR